MYETISVRGMTPAVKQTRQLLPPIEVDKVNIAENNDHKNEEAHDIKLKGVKVELIETNIDEDMEI